MIIHIRALVQALDHGLILEKIHRCIRFRQYVIHIRALVQALDHGLILEKIHRCIRFRQSPWMKEHIEHNTRLGTAARNDFEKDFYKLMNNSVFGKTMENIVVIEI